MPLKTTWGENPTLNLTPLIDVVFNLMVFFMVCTKFYDMERQFDVDLPEVAEAAPLTSPPQAIVINVHDDGRLVVEDRQLSLPELVERLRQARLQYADQSVLIRGDRETPYQRIAEVLSACAQAEIRHMNLGAKLELPRGISAAASGQGESARELSKSAIKRVAALRDKQGVGERGASKQ